MMEDSIKRENVICLVLYIQGYVYLHTSIRNYLCDRICKKGSYTRNYKYLEIPI